MDWQVASLRARQWAHVRFTPEGVSLRGEALAGLVSAAVALPQAIAFAGLAGLPPQMGVWACVIPLLLVGLLGELPLLVTGPVVSTSLVMFSTLQLYALPGSSAYISDVAIVTLGAGLMQLLLSASGLVRLIEWIRAWGTEAITTSVGLTLILSQVPYALGRTPAMLPNWQKAWTCLAALGNSSVESFALFALTLALGLAMGRLPPRIRQLRLALMLVAGSVAAWAFGLQVQKVGYARLGLPWTHILLDAQTKAWLPQWAGLMLDVAVLSLLQSVVLCRALKLRGACRRVSLRRQGLAQGLANVVCALTGGYVSGASFNRTLTHEKAGARSMLALLFSAGFLLAAVLSAPSLIAQIPYPAMAAMLVMTALNMLEFHQARKRWFLAASSCAVIFTGVFLGLGLAVAFAFAIAVAQHLADTKEHRKD